MRILVTGAAGFIGFHLSKRLLDGGHDVVGYDNVNDYYDPRLKEARLRILREFGSFQFYRNDLEDEVKLNAVVDRQAPEIVVHLAAQAGVRYSLANPRAYIDSNVVGFFNILEACHNHEVAHLVYASSSSVYGLNETMPFSTKHGVDHPVSLYGATKRSNELMAHTYSHLYNLPTTGLRFFTVYGPWGRPDMALFLFTEAILKGETIDVYNNGEMKRDFTFIDDIINGLLPVLNSPPKSSNHWNGQLPDPSSSQGPFKLYNIGNNSPVNLMDFIAEIERQLEKKAKINYEPLQPGDVVASHANVADLVEDFDYRPQTDIRVGIGKFVDWYLDYYE